MKFHFITLGCPKNRVDSEVMFGTLLKHQYEYTDQPKEAELIVVNSCSFIEDAKQESINTILQMSEFKKQGTLKKLVVAGCLAQRYQGQVEKLFPEVDHFIGTGEYYKIASVIESEKRGNYSVPSYIHTYEAPRLNSMPFYTAYLKLTEGCDRKCTFCIIPTIRGKQKSQTIENLVKETEALVQSGATEFNLIGQDLTAYGTDLKDANLTRLLKELVKIKGIRWIRLLYAYPAFITDDLISLIRSEEKICKYIDMPLQHIDDEILVAMKRGVNSRHIYQLIDRLRTAIADLTLRTSFITGFPGETNAQFQHLYSFVKEMAFDHVGVFSYSSEEGTGAFHLANAVPKKLRLKRKEEIMMLQSEISLKHHQSQLGKKKTVLIEGWDREKKLFQGRHPGQAPEIDGTTYVDAPSKTFKPGEYVDVELIKAFPYDLISTPHEN